jgi:hypothetical protein
VPIRPEAAGGITFDYESAPTVSLWVKGTDDEGLSIDRPFTLSVTDHEPDQRL